MARSIWTGSISFGLVNVPVSLYSAVSEKTVRFNQLNGQTGNRISQKRVDPGTGDEVNFEDIVKGYELTKDRYIIIEPGELDALAPEKTKAIDIETFSDLAQVDPILYDKHYYLTPAKGAAKAYTLLLNALREEGKVAIGRVILRSKEKLVALRADGDVLVCSTLMFADEIVSRADLDLDEPAQVADRELEMARSLIASLTDDFDPSAYRDEYRERVLKLIEAKAAGETYQPPAAPEREQVPDLMAALEASLADAQAKGKQRVSAKARRGERQTTSA